ncbi:hypothetical protein Pint_13440 [Pistacia integerrima]|uniref:Uncharacterized protein n=1 Tax=Pistacia integerrima TaxID=434235 RepID=A0ACC0Y5K5_9ROSI|nr:hypothetical protein Pint_13440 [Pistacia integerrima]
MELGIISSVSSPILSFVVKYIIFFSGEGNSEDRAELLELQLLLLRGILAIEGTMSSTRENIELQDATTIAAKSTSNRPPQPRPNVKSEVWQHFENIVNKRTNKIEWKSVCIVIRSCCIVWLMALLRRTSILQVARSFLTMWTVCRDFSRLSRAHKKMESKEVRLMLGDLIKRSVAVAC